jgi:hypothetical protein
MHVGVRDRCRRHTLWVGLAVAVVLALPGCNASTGCSDGKITTQSVPDGALGLPYAFAFAQSCGGTGASWEVSDGQLPPGLTLSWDGHLSGVPSVAGTYAFQIRVTFSNRDWGAATYTSGRDTHAFTLNVRE